MLIYIWVNIYLYVDNNRIYSRPNFIDTDFLDPETGAPFTDGRLFNDGQILDIGGSYRNHFAIVKNWLALR